MLPAGKTEQAKVKRQDTAVDKTDTKAPSPTVQMPLPYGQVTWGLLLSCWMQGWTHTTYL